MTNRDQKGNMYNIWLFIENEYLNFFSICQLQAFVNIQQNCFTIHAENSIYFHVCPFWKSQLVLLPFLDKPILKQQNKLFRNHLIKAQKMAKKGQQPKKVEI